MNRTAPVLLLASLIIHSTSPLAALAGGAAFVGVGSGSNVSGVSVSSRHGRSTASISIRIGNRRVPTPWHYYVAAPLYYPKFANEDGQKDATDVSGVLHINGYPVSPSGWLRVQVEPRDAEILVDGSPVAAEKASGLSNSLGLLVGRHHVEVRKDGYETYQADLPIQQAREVLLQVTLKK